MKIEIKENVVTNDGEEIGRIQDGICYSPLAIAPVVKGQINEAHGEKLKFEVGQPPELGPIGEDGPVGNEGQTRPSDPGLSNHVIPINSPQGPQEPSPFPADFDPYAGSKCSKFKAWKEGK